MEEIQNVTAIGIENVLKNVFNVLKNVLNVLKNVLNVLKNVLKKMEIKVQIEYGKSRCDPKKKKKLIPKTTM